MLKPVEGQKAIAFILGGKKAKVELSGLKNAEECIGTLEPGYRMVGITKGQFSLIDIVKALVAQTGPADLIVCTWSIGIRDAENVDWLLSQNLLRSFRLLVDRSFQLVNAKNAGVVRAKFGTDFIRSSNVHAKFFLLGNERWKLVCRSSMNLNRNPRFEQFDIDDDAGLFSFFENFVSEVWRMAKPGMESRRGIIDPPFKASFGGITEAGEVALKQEAKKGGLPSESIDELDGLIGELPGLDSVLPND